MTDKTVMDPFLQEHFGETYLEDVPRDIFKSAITSTARVLNHPDRFPRADFDYLRALEQYLMTAKYFGF